MKAAGKGVIGMKILGQGDLRSKIDEALQFRCVREELSKRLADIESGVGRIKVPLSFAGELYVLREHVNFVRARLVGKPETGGIGAP